MADYEIDGSPEDTGKKFMENIPKMASLLQSDVVPVEPASAASETSSSTFINLFNDDTQLLLAALCSCIVVFSLVLTGFVRYRERIRRYVTGENRRVGSVYYVRPGMAATQPTEI